MTPRVSNAAIARARRGNLLRVLRALRQRGADWPGQEAVAGMIGSSQPAVSRAMSHLRRKGLVRYSARAGRITIHSVAPEVAA